MANIFCDMYYVPFVTMATVEFWSVYALSAVLALLPRYVSFSPFCIYFKDMLSYVGAVEGEFFYICCTRNISIVNCIGHRKE